MEIKMFYRTFQAVPKKRNKNIRKLAGLTGLAVLLFLGGHFGGLEFQKYKDEREAIKQEHFTKLYNPRIIRYKAVPGDNPWEVCSQHRGEERTNDILPIYFLLNDEQKIMYAGKTYKIPCYDMPAENK